MSAEYRRSRQMAADCYKRYRRVSIIGYLHHILIIAYIHTYYILYVLCAGYREQALKDII